MKIEAFFFIYMWNKVRNSYIGREKQNAENEKKKKKKKKKWCMMDGFNVKLHSCLLFDVQKWGFI